MSLGAKNRILILNLEISGVNTYLFSLLEKKGWKLTIVDVPVPKICILLAFIFSFSPDILRWKRQFKQNIGKFAKIPWAFIQRTKFCEKKIIEMNEKIDIIFQISGMYAPTKKYQNLRIPFVTFNDYTMALAKKNPDADLWHSQMERWLTLEQNLYRNARFIFTTSENTRKSFIGDYGIEPEKVVTVRYGTTLQTIQQGDKTYTNKTILFIGKSFEQKGGFVLLDAFQKVLEKIPDAQLIIAGVKEEYLRIKHPNVQIYGYIKDRNVINDLYEKSSAFVMPSFFEAFGLVFLEAMSHRLPCVGTAVDAIPEIIEDGKTGLLVPLKNVDALAGKIEILLKNPDLCRKMGSEGFKRLNEKFSWNQLGETIDLYLKKCI